MHEDNKVYKKVGIKYQEVGFEFRGFPANGVWVVKDGSQNCIYQFNDVLQQPTPTLVSYMQYSEELMKKFVDEWDKRALNARDLAGIACEFFAMKAGGMKIGDEIIE
jgi:hypothetical protein